MNNTLKQQTIVAVVKTLATVVTAHYGKKILETIDKKILKLDNKPDKKQEIK